MVKGRGKKDCRVCPAIKKWMEKHGHDCENYEKGNATEEATGEDGSNEQFHDGIFQVGSDATTDMTLYMTADIRKSIKAVSSPKQSAAQGKTKEVNSSKKKSGGTSRKSENKSPEKANEILEKPSAKIRTDSTGDNGILKDSKQSAANSKTKEVNGSKKKGTSRKSENKSPEKANEILEKPSAKIKTDSSDNGIRKDSNFVMDAISKVNIEQRAKEIIKEVRNKEGWDDSEYPKLSPIENNGDKDDGSYIQGLADARAEEIIKRARAFFHKEKEEASEVAPSRKDDEAPQVSLEIAYSDVLTPGSIVKTVKESFKNEIKDSMQLSMSCNSSSRLVKKQGNWVKVDDGTTTASSFETTRCQDAAARSLQSFARMVLSRKIFLDYLGDKRTKMYRKMLAGKGHQSTKSDASRELKVKPDAACDMMSSNNKCDTILESRSQDLGKVQRNRDPEGRVQYSGSTARDPEGDVSLQQTESSHVDNRVEARKSVDGTRLNPNPAQKILDLTQLQVDHQEIDDSSKLQLPEAEPVYDADVEVVNAADMVHCSTPMTYAREGNSLIGFKTCINDRPNFDTEEDNIADLALSARENAMFRERAIMQNNAPDAGAGEYRYADCQTPKQRNTFERVACSFDDTVSKVVKRIVGCSNGGEVFMSQYKSASTSASSFDGSFNDAKRRAASYNIMYRTSLGWTIADRSCCECQMPMMKRPGDNRFICVVCDEVDDTDNVTLGSFGTKLRSETRASGEMRRADPVSASCDKNDNTDNVMLGTPETQLRSEALAPASVRETRRNDPMPVSPSNMTRVHEPRQIYKPDPEPNHAEPPSNYDYQTVHRSSNMPLRNWMPVESQFLSPIQHRRTSAKSTYSLPYMEANPNHRRKTSTTSAYSRSRMMSSENFLAPQQLLSDQICPHCNMGMARNAYNGNHQCHSCGMIILYQGGAFPEYESDVSLIDDDNTADNSELRNPFSFAHQQMIANQQNTNGIRAMQKQQHVFGGHPTFSPPIYVLPKYEDNSSCSNSQQRNLDYHRKHDQNLDTLSFQPPKSNIDQIKRKYINQQQIYSNVSVKENSYGDANMNPKQLSLSSIEEAELRIVKAQNASRQKVPYYYVK